MFPLSSLFMWRWWYYRETAGPCETTALVLCRLIAASSFRREQWSSRSTIWSQRPISLRHHHDSTFTINDLSTKLCLNWWLQQWLRLDTEKPTLEPCCWSHSRSHSQSQIYLVPSRPYIWYLYFFSFLSSGWKSDWRGGWVKDEDVEFDSDEDEPTPINNWDLCPIPKIINNRFRQALQSRAEPDSKLST